MNYLKNIMIVWGIALGLTSCFDKTTPNYQYMPNMYEPVGYETYQMSNAFPGGFEALLPPEYTIKRGHIPYKYPNTPEGKIMATAALKSPLNVQNIKKNLKVGKELYNIYCGICHGAKGDGQGNLVKREKILGVPSYDAREINEGSTYHVIYHGLNSMGSYANQLNETERWQVTLYVMELRKKLLK